VNSITVFSPAKLNLFLAVTGRRADGYHELLSVAAALTWGDSLTARVTGGDLVLECTDPRVPVGEGNLVIRAARLFREATGWNRGVAFSLEKRIPMGAGLGGGSSNAVAALRALNALAGEPLDSAALTAISAGVGSDCPLFLHGGPVVIRGRGERVRPLDAPGAAGRLAGRRVVIFKPGFSIGTAEAYAALDRRGGCHPGPEAAEARLAGWIGEPSAPAEKLLFNSFEETAFRKYPALPVLCAALREEAGLSALMTGSGSACFALLGEDAGIGVAAVREAVASRWGAAALVVEAAIGPECG
jgi:4-diphosphocytidyl-2-C-methyl-D-erythritol kinase